MPRLVTKITTPRMQWHFRYGVIFWRVARMFSSTCSLCTAGICWQRVEWFPGRDTRIWIHGHLPN